MAYTPLREATIRRGLSTEVIGGQIVCLKSVGSTNDWLKAAAAEGAVEGLAVFAEEQTAGRGQAGRHWVVPLGSSLLVSILLRPRFPPDELPYLTMLGACAAAAAASELTGRSIQIKWPNDLVWQDAKLGGALTESSLEGDAIEYAVLGIGVNVNLTRRQLAGIPGATSLQAQRGHPVNRNTLARRLLRGLDERYAQLRAGDRAGLVAEWRSRLQTLGQRVTRRIGSQLDGPYLAADVTDRGALILERPDGSRFTAVAGEVSVLPESMFE
jgi:BirA family transcriptional regulator, biotin operon repressor / biotin---[acetyl-CoA-carboxylase] ligase